LAFAPDPGALEFLPRFAARHCAAATGAYPTAPSARRSTAAFRIGPPERTESTRVSWGAVLSLEASVTKMDSKETVILVAEDDAIVRNLVRLMLSKEGYAVLTAGDGQEALEICEFFKDPIHLILTDVNMPRMDGLEFAERVRKQRPEIKIVLMSGQTITTIREENVHDAFLRKPFIPPTLLTCIQRVLMSEFKGDCEDLRI
jgi:CheY-like chemotaxis protein